MNRKAFSWFRCEAKSDVYKRQEIFGVQKDSGEIILAAKLPPEYTIDEGDKVICCRVVD